MSALHDLDAEEAVLGAMLVCETIHAPILAAIGPGDFYRREHALIFRAIARLHRRGVPIDAVSVTDELTAIGALRDAGGRGYVHGLTAAVSPAANAPYHAQTVRRYAHRRAVAALARRLADVAEAPGVAVDAQLEELALRLLRTTRDDARQASSTTSSTARFALRRLR